MADEALRLRADVIDRATPVLRKIRKEMGEFRKTPGMEALGKQMGTLQEQLEGFTKSGGGLTGTLNALGAGGLTAATSLVGLVARFKELAQQTQVLKEIGRETGLTVDQLNQLQHVAPRFNVSADQMTKGLETFSDKMIDVRRGWGDVVSELNGQGLGAFVKKLQKDSPADAVRDAFSLLGSDKLMANPALQKRWTEMLFGDGGLTALFAQGAKGVEGEWDNLAKTLDPIKPETLKSAEDMAKALQSLRTEITNLENVAEPVIFKTMATDLRDIAAIIGVVTNGLKYLDTLKENPGVALSPYYKNYRDKDDVFAPPTSDADGQDRLGKMRAERDALAAKLDADKAKNPIGFATRDAADISRLGELNLAVKQMLDALKQAPAPGDADGRAHVRRMRLDGFNQGIGGLRQNVAFTGATGFGTGDSSPLAEAVERGVFKGLVDFANRGDLDSNAAGGAGGEGGGIINAAYHPGGGLDGDNTSIGRAFRRGGGSGGADTPDGAGNAGAVKGSMGDRAMTAMAYLVDKKGYTPEGAAIAVGNAMQESGVNAGVRPGDRGISHSMFQWNKERWAAYQRFSAGRGKSTANDENALDFFDEERKHRSGLEAQWHLQHNLRNAGRLGHLFEGYGDNSEGTRVQNARNVLDAYRRAHQSTTAGQPSHLSSSQHVSLLDLARDAGVTHQTHELTGGAHVRIQLAGGAGMVKGVSTQSTGMIKSVALDRGTSMMPTIG